jgi:hypothetical protein
MADIVVENLRNEASSRVFVDGSTRAESRLPSMSIGRGTYLPGWRWSEHAGPQTGKASLRHLGLIESGRMTIRSADGSQVTVGPGDAFEVGPGHDAWVVGDEPCIALDFCGV